MEGVDGIRKCWNAICDVIKTAGNAVISCFSKIAQEVKNLFISKSAGEGSNVLNAAMENRAASNAKTFGKDESAAKGYSAWESTHETELQTVKNALSGNQQRITSFIDGLGLQFLSRDSDAIDAKQKFAEELAGSLLQIRLFQQKEITIDQNSFPKIVDEVLSQATFNSNLFTGGGSSFGKTDALNDFKAMLNSAIGAQFLAKNLTVIGKSSDFDAAKYNQ